MRRRRRASEFPARPARSCARPSAAPRRSVRATAGNAASARRGCGNDHRLAGRRVPRADTLGELPTGVDHRSHPFLVARECRAVITTSRGRFGGRHTGADQRQIQTLPKEALLGEAPAQATRDWGTELAGAVADYRAPSNNSSSPTVIRPAAQHRTVGVVHPSPHGHSGSACCGYRAGNLSDRIKPASLRDYLSGNPVENPAAMSAAAMTDRTAMLHMANLFDCGPSGFTVA